MQQLARTSIPGPGSAGGTAYTSAQFLAQWASPTAFETYAWDRLDASKAKIGDLTPFVDYSTVPTIQHDVTRPVRRTLSNLRIRGDAPLNPLHDLIRPHYQLRMPDGGYLDFVLGTFALLPTRKEIRQGYTWLTLQGADLSQLLVDAGFPVSTGLPANESVTSGAIGLISGYGGLTPMSALIPDAGEVLPAAMGWEYGNNPLQAASDLMAALSYFSPWADELGVMRSSLIPDWNTVAPLVTFDATQGFAAIRPPIIEQPDFSRAFNQAIVVIEDPRRPALSAPYTNNNPNSPISVQKWHVKTKVIRDSRVVDYATASLVGRAAVQESARVYTPLLVDTHPWPAWHDQDVCKLVYQATDSGGVIQDLFVVAGFVHRCKVGQPTTHTLLRIVPS